MSAINYSVSDQELLAACRVLSYGKETDSLFTSVESADELALLLGSMDSKDAVLDSIDLLCDVGVIWQVLFAMARRFEKEALYDDIASLLVANWEHGSPALQRAACWTFLNRHHNTYEWLSDAVTLVSDPAVLQVVSKKWPRLLKGIKLP